MTAPEEIRSGVGLRKVQVLALNADGYPNASGTTAYEGVTISGAVSLSMEDPEPQQIVHRGDDNIFAIDVLPPTEPISAELTVSKTNDDVDVVLTDDKSITIGEAKLFGAGTDNRGDENQVCLIAYQQTLDTDPDSSNFGARRWGMRLFPKAYVIPRESGFDQDTPTSRAYTIRPLFCTKYPWGVSFTTGTEGFVRAQVLRGVSQYKPKVVAFKSDGTTARSDFPSTAPAADTGKITVWVDGVESTPETVETSGFEWTTGDIPTTNAMVVVFYEVE